MSPHCSVGFMSPGRLTGLGNYTRTTDDYVIEVSSDPETSKVFRYIKTSRTSEDQNRVK